MSTCHVSLIQGDGSCDSADFFRASLVTARRHYHCCECLDPIPIGASHQRIAMRYGGDQFSYRTCLACVEIHRALAGSTFRMTECLWTDIEETVFPGMTTACVRKCATVAAKQKLTARWLDWKFERSA